MNALMAQTMFDFITEGPEAKTGMKRKWEEEAVMILARVEKERREEEPLCRINLAPGLVCAVRICLSTANRDALNYIP